jgi:hypothetical protein
LLRYAKTICFCFFYRKNDDPVMARSPGVGNYDVNIMLNALQKKGMSTRWFDARKCMCAAIGRFGDGCAHAWRTAAIRWVEPERPFFVVPNWPCTKNFTGQQLVIY